MKKNLLRVLSSAFLLLTACGGETVSSVEGPSSNQDNSSVAQTSSSNIQTGPFITEDVTIHLWSITGKNNQEQLQSYVDAFMAKEPHVTVVNTIQTGMGYNELKDATEKAFTAETHPDIVQCYPDHVAEYLDYNKAVDLDPYINNPEYGWSTEEKNDYIESFLEEGTQYSVPGTYSVPYCKSTELMFYNPVMLGIDLSQIDATINDGLPLNEYYFNNLTWEELFNKFCPAIVTYNDSLPEDKKILKSDQAHHGVFAYDSDDNLFITLCAQYGIPYTHIDEVTGEGVFDFYENEEARNKLADILVKYNGYFKNGYITTQGVLKAYTNTLFTAQNSLFSVGSTAGVSHQFSTSNPMDVEVTSIPKAADGDLKTIKQGPSLCILSHGALGKPDTNEVKNRKLASWLLYKTITSAKNSTTWSLNTGYTPIRKSTKESKKWLEYTEYEDLDANTIDSLKARNAEYTAQDKIQNSLFTSPAFLGSSTSRTAVGAALTQALQATSLDKAGALTILSNAYTEAKKAQ
jgi:ABC-type glycerol-3-phosphate transport system substrate-binding protein